jgi:hypothetical protein
VRLQDLEAKYNGLLDRHQTYLLKASSPINLTVRAINLPFVDSHQFDGFDVFKDSEKKQEKKVSAFVTMIMGEGFFYGHVCREIVKQIVTYSILASPLVIEMERKPMSPHNFNTK